MVFAIPMRPRIAYGPALKAGDNEKCNHVCKSGTHGAEDPDAKLGLWEYTQIKAEDCAFGHGDDGNIHQFISEVDLALR